MPVHDAALLLLGHGSTLNADSSTPTLHHANELRRRGLFHEVHVAFWKEEPNFRQALRQTSGSRVYIVPNFISSGYFTEQVIPRELGLDGPVTHREGQTLFYCDPVGLHSSMTEALLRRAEEVVAASGEAIADRAKTTCLFICGHGTSLNDNSTKIIHEQAGLIRARGIFADCQGVLMEQKPFVKDWRTLTDCPNVIVVPFFIADGLHSFEDIPVLLGLTHDMKEKRFTNPHREEDRRLWYSGAIGTEAFLADVIVAQVEQFDLRYPEARSSTAGPVTNEIETGLRDFLSAQAAPWILGEVLIGPDLRLIHRKDQAVPIEDLRELNSPEDLQELARFDAKGNFRPLHAAPNLRRGWIYCATDTAALHCALDQIYPGELANWNLWHSQRLQITSWRETAERQTGRFRVVRELKAEGLADLVTKYCELGCLKRRLWEPAAQPVSAVPGEVVLLCPEACNFLVERARGQIKGGSESGE